MSLVGQATRKHLKKEDLRQLHQILRGGIDTEVTELDPGNRRLLPNRHKVFSTRLHIPMRVHGLELGAGSETFYTDGGRLTSIALGADTEIEGNTYPEGSVAHFFPEGRVDWISLAQDVTLRLARPKLKQLRAQRLVSFYRNGVLKECTLANPMLLGGYEIPEDSIVHFSNEGQLVWVQISQAMSFELQDKLLVARDHSCVEFHHNGTLRAIVLAAATEIQGHRFRQEVTVCFDMAGRLSLAKLREAIAKPDGQKSSQTAVRFHRDGMIREVTVT